MEYLNDLKENLDFLKKKKWKDLSFASIFQDVHTQHTIYM